MMMSTFARADVLLTAALLLGSSGAPATAAAGEQIRPSTVTAGESVENGLAAAITKVKSKPVKGFQVVKELPQRVQAGLSPANDELWLATTTDGGTVQLDHLRAGRWTTEALPVDGWVGSASLTGKSADDVWLAAGASLRRYDGSRWTAVALPTLDSGGEPVWFDTLESPRKGVLYAALSSNAWKNSSRVFRYAKGRWTALGAPAPDLEDHKVLEMKIVDGALMTRSAIQWQNAFYSNVGGTWTRLYSIWLAGGDYTGVLGGWYPRSYSNHVILGAGGFFGVVPKCEQWIGSEPLVDCTTTRATAASAQLRNGTIVLAESDYRGSADPQFETTPYVQGDDGDVQGGFGLRDLDGRETSLAGDPGDSTQFVVAEAHRNAAWAVTSSYTDTGRKYYLQRYEG